jgi:hypothetical protein
MKVPAEQLHSVLGCGRSITCGQESLPSLKPHLAPEAHVALLRPPARRIVWSRCSSGARWPIGDEAAIQPSSDRQFQLYAITLVGRRTTVTWTNDDDDVHTVVEKERKFKSAALDTHDAFAQTFTTPGEYDYFCSLHPQMVGKIIVKPPGSS